MNHARLAALVAIGGLTLLVTRITDSVTSAAAVVHCGKQVVLAPRTVCR